MKTLDKTKFGAWAIVTGASSSIGKEFARQVAASGINVVLVARRLPLLEELGRTLANEYGIQYRAVEADLADVDSIEKLAAATQHLDIGLVISNAGATEYGNFLTMERTALDRNLHLNVSSHLHLIHRYGQGLVKRGRGGVILVSSMAGLQGTPFMADYAASKAYLLSLGEALHIELGKVGVHVTVLLPGPTDTPMLANSGTDPSDMPMKPMSVEQCVREGLAALTANRVSYLPGRMNRVIVSLIPRSVRPKMMGSMIEKGLTRKNAPSKI